MQNGLAWYIMIHQGGKRLVYGRNKKQRKSGRAGLRRGLCRLFIGRLGGNDALVLSSGIYGEGLCSGHAPQIRAGPRRKLLFFLRAAGGSAGAKYSAGFSRRVSSHGSAAERLAAADRGRLRRARFAHTAICNQKRAVDFRSGKIKQLCRKHSGGIPAGAN